MFPQLLLIFSILVSNILNTQGAGPLCPCEDQSLCKPVNYSGKEVYAFVGESNRTVWSNFDWTRLTTIALFDFYDPELLCFAHKSNVRVVTLGVFPKSDLTNTQKIEHWIDTQIDYTRDHFLDGINIDIEYEIENNSELEKALTSFVSRVTNRFHTAFPLSQVTFDVPWSPVNEKGTGVDGRNYNFTALAEATDFLFIMAYDERSQVFGTDCDARANSNLFWTAGGILAYLQLGIDANKLVLGLPWYGYDYKCISTAPERTCYIAKVPFRGVECSDAAGRQLPYVDIKQIADVVGSNYDEHSTTRFLYFNDTATNTTHQIWYDDSSSLSLKVGFATYKNLRGVGVWNANMLDYSGSAQSKAMISDMWGTFPQYKTGQSTEGRISRFYSRNAKNLFKPMNCQKNNII